MKFKNMHPTVSQKQYMHLYRKPNV